MTDQQRWDALSLLSDWVQTPNLDALVQEGGVHFTQCVTNSPVCMPARRTMATGHYPHLTHVWDNGNFTLPAGQPTWMAALRDAGYRTALVGKTHFYQHSGDMRSWEPHLRALGLDDINETPGPRACARTLSHMTDAWHVAGYWDAYAADYAERFSHKHWVVRPSALPLEHYYDTYVGQKMTRYLAGYDREQPWFAWVSFGGPHEPWDTPEPYASRYAPAAMPAPLPRFTDAAPERPTGSLDRKKPNPDLVPDVPALRADYAGNVTLIDDQVGHIISAIKARGDWDNTVVIMTSDHGEMNGDHGLIYKSNFLDSAVRVPLLVSTPATRAAGQARRSDALVEWMDVGATFLDYAGVDYRHRQYARSVRPSVEDPARPHRDFAISQIAHETMILTPDWKLVLNAKGQPYLLFDRQADPDEQRNLAGHPDHAATESALTATILQHRYTTML